MLSDEQLSERVCAELRAELEDVRPRPGFLDGLWEEARQTEPSGRDRAHPADRPGWLTFGNLATVTAAGIALVVAAVVIFSVAHHEPEGPAIATTDAVLTPSPAKLSAGAAAGPSHVAADSFQGAAIPDTVRLVAETPDPHGGLPWGLREFQTTRGQTCLQVGRVQTETIGVIGQDGAWADDHRFHPISPNAYTGDHCTATDATGHAFDNVAIDGGGKMASADVEWGTGLQGDGCGGSNAGRPEPACPERDRRDLNYGLLGPDAVSITFVGSGGRRYVEPANPPDGAYLIVSAPGASGPTCVLQPDGGRGCSSGGMTSGPQLQSGIITRVVYRNGHVCQLPAPTSGGVQQASCPLVGYAGRPVRRLTSAQVAAPVTARALPAKHYCTSGPLTLAPCRPGQTPVKSETGSVLFDITFTARVNVTSGNSYYEYADRYPSGPGAGCRNQGGGSSGTTLQNVRAGRRVVFQDQVDKSCAGTVHGTVGFIPNAGAAGFGSGPSPRPGHDGSLLVGTFSLSIK